MKDLSRRHFLQGLAAAGAAAAVGRLGLPLPWAASSQSSQPLNFVFILIDDMGWRDLTCFGSALYRTPNIDRLAERGMVFTQAYAPAALCAPSRVGMMTGKYPARLHCTGLSARYTEGKLLEGATRDWREYLPPQEVTLGEALKGAGYRTMHIGKWHMGVATSGPKRQGFDGSFAEGLGGFPKSYWYPYGAPNAVPGGREGEYLTDRLTEEAERFLRENRDQPFFLHLSHYAVHSPIMAKKEVEARYAARIKEAGLDARPTHLVQNNAVFAAMVESVDESVGKVVSTLEELGLTDRTVVFFMSDNGGMLRSTCNLPLRAGKGTLYEGGIRVPLIVSWPGVTRPGSRCETPVHGVDFWPTIAGAAAAPGAKDADVDGEDLMPLLSESGGLKRDALFWHFPHYDPGRTTPCAAVRRGDFKLIRYFEDDRLELYNLKDDVGEQKNLADDAPEKARELAGLLEQWLRDVGASMPRPNPDYKPAPA